MSKSNSISAKKKNPKDDFPVVGIGASAGGLDAIKRFLQALPPKSGIAYVFIQHLSPTHNSILPEILEKISPIPVHHITDEIVLQQDNFYIIPQNKKVVAVDGKLRTESFEKTRNTHKTDTIDLFFSSLGSVYQSHAIGVVLSGALSDGTVGLQIIKSYGGLTFAQDEDSATFESMPKSAIDAGVVDFVLTPEDIARRLIAINQPFHADYLKEETEQSEQHDDDIFRQILMVLRVRRGVDFQYYKSSTLKRRIVRRMALIKVENLTDYLYQLRESKVEQDALYNDMLISVTNFFRDEKTFEVLCAEILPGLIRQKLEKNEPLRVWVAGCASGEEAYSIAMCMHEQLGDKLVTMKVQIFATDISETAINKARSGVYRQNELAGLSTLRVQQFFNKLDGSYHVKKSIRDLCVFAHHNLLKDPPFSKVDLVSCRNVLIYLEPVLQKRALTTFHYALNEKAYLMLGRSETIGSHTDIFTSFQSGEKIYVRKGLAGKFMSVASQGREQSFRNMDKIVQQKASEKDIFKLADEVMLADFMPPGVLLNDKYDIIQFRGSTENWLIPPQGKPNFNVLKMARDGLVFELRNLLQLVKKNNFAVRKPGVFFKINDLQHYVNLQAIPIQHESEQYFLVVFQTASSTGIQGVMFENEELESTNYDAAELRIEHLERELVQSRADMRVITDEQEAINEELQSANEELLSGSEELQSINEELETSKEELQSINEEIIIVNKELVDRNEQLNSARLYAESIVNTIRESLIILDKSLKVKRATKGFYTKFKVNENETEGRYLYELGNNQWNIPELKNLLERILPDKKSMTNFEVRHTFPGIGEKVMCLNATLLDNINGEELILLALEDITEKPSA